MKISPRACRHCGSPAKGNPCFWSIDKPKEWAGFDPPCYGDEHDERVALGERRLRRWWTAIVLAFIVIAALVFVLARPASAYTCEHARQYRAEILSMPKVELRRWIKALGLSRKQVRQARACLGSK